ADRAPLDADTVREAHADDREDEDLDRRGRHAKPVVEGRDRERNADHHHLLTDRERLFGQARTDPLLHRMARERRAEGRQRRHEEKGRPGADRAQGVRHPHDRARVMRADAPCEADCKDDEEPSHGPPTLYALSPQARTRYGPGHGSSAWPWLRRLV